MAGLYESHKAVAAMRRLLVLALLGLTLAGCARARPATQPAALVPAATQAAASDDGLDEPTKWPEVVALVRPPVGWRAVPLKSSRHHTHQVWISPTGRTAYGVISFGLPIPVPADLLLPAYLSAMRKDQGEAILISRQKDPELPGVRFIAEGGLYRVRTNLMSRGLRGWGVYAGTLRAEPVDTAELELAERARESTRIGL